MPPTPRNLYVSSICLTAVLRAVSLSRDFVRQTLRLWQLADQIDIAELIVSELATNAVKSTGITNPAPTCDMVKAHHIIGLQLRLVEASLYVEVWDRGSGTPAVPDQRLDAEGGRGLFLVDALSKRWDIHRPTVGGKIVWSELALIKPVSPSLLDDGLPLRHPGSHDPLASGELELVDMALTQRVLDDLRVAPRRDVEAVSV